MSGVRIAHVNIRVTDIERSLEFYTTLGLTVTGCLLLGEGSYAVYAAATDAPDLTIELVVNENADASYDRSPGSGHVALAVGDLDAVLERLAGAGIELESAPFHPGGREELRVCFVRDPDGARVELIEGAFHTPQDHLPEPLRRFRR